MNIPEWLQTVINKKSCHKCEKKLSNKGITGIGTEHSLVKGKETMCFFFLYQCPHCNAKKKYTGFPTHWEEFIEDVVFMSGMMEEIDEQDMEEMMSIASGSEDDIKPKESSDDNVKPPKSRITDKEMKNYREMLSKHTLKDLLANEGIIPFPELKKPDGDKKEEDE